MPQEDNASDLSGGRRDLVADRIGSVTLEIAAAAHRVQFIA